jgi:hypothetical protein
MLRRLAYWLAFAGEESNKQIEFSFLQEAHGCEKIAAQYVIELESFLLSMSHLVFLKILLLVLP